MACGPEGRVGFRPRGTSPRSLFQEHPHKSLRPLRRRQIWSNSCKASSPSIYGRRKLPGGRSSPAKGKRTEGIIWIVLTMLFFPVTYRRVFGIKNFIFSFCPPGPGKNSAIPPPLCLDFGIGGVGRRRDWGRVKLTFYLLSFQRNQASSFIPIAQGGRGELLIATSCWKGKRLRKKAFNFNLFASHRPMLWKRQNSKRNKVVRLEKIHLKVS